MREQTYLQKAQNKYMPPGARRPESLSAARPEQEYQQKQEDYKRDRFKNKTISRAKAFGQIIHGKRLKHGHGYICIDNSRRDFAMPPHQTVEKTHSDKRDNQNHIPAGIGKKLRHIGHIGQSRSGFRKLGGH